MAVVVVHALVVAQEVVWDAKEPAQVVAKVFAVAIVRALVLAVALTDAQEVTVSRIKLWVGGGIFY